MAASVLASGSTSVDSRSVNRYTVASPAHTSRWRRSIGRGAGRLRSYGAVPHGYRKHNSHSSPSHLRDYLVDGTNHHIWSIQLQPMAAVRHDLHPPLEAARQTLVLGPLSWARVSRRKHDQWHVGSMSVISVKSTPSSGPPLGW